MNNILMQDAAHYPQLFVWNGAIESNQLEVWLQEHQLNLPQDLIELWKRTNGGDLFESETILSPFGDDSLGDDIEGVNEFHYSQGMARKYLLFHLGTGLSAVRLTDGYYVKLDESYQEIDQFQTLDDWYRDELRSEYGKRYSQNMGDIKMKSPLAALEYHRQRLESKIQSLQQLNLLTAHQRSLANEQLAKIDQVIQQLKDGMSSADVEDSSSEFSYKELKEQRRNVDFPAWQNVKDLLEEIDPTILGVTPERIAEVENTLNPVDNPSGWLLPTAILCVQDLDLFPQGDSGSNQKQEIDRLFLEKLMTPERIEETLSNWKEEPLIKNRYSILKEAVQVHLCQKFYASVSTLMPQMEGLIRDLQTKDGHSSFGDLLATKVNPEINMVKIAIQNLIDDWTTKAPNLIQKDTVMLEKLPDVVSNLYKKYDESTRQLGDEKIYRNGICHGLQLDFGSPENSLKLILIIDRIVSFYTQFKAS